MYGFKVAINGCFDLFHSAHQHIIKIAMRYSYGGHVFVLLNSDESIQKLKGPDRPIESVTERAGKIETFFGHWSPKMDYPKLKINIFNTEEELSNLLDEYKPDMIIKGDDWTDISKITGAGKWPIMIVPRGKDCDGKDISTSRLIIERYT
jgi:D-beta-D-heptose 7-phosphate kinase/D-beta-D-heptose 1-phosphate adenosyltransferase